VFVDGVLRVNVELNVFVTSDDDIVFVAVAADGTVMIVEKLPRLELVTVALVTLLNFIVIVELAANPLPLIVTGVPTGPDVPLRSCTGVTVNVAAAVLLEPSLVIT
jgi:hypothetical protein